MALVAHPIGAEHKKRVDITLADKVKIIQALKEPGATHNSVARYFNLCRTAVLKINNRANEILALYASSRNHNRMRQRFSRVEFVDEELYQWYSSQISSGFTISGPRLQAKASEIAANHGQTFKPSEGWLTRWKRRYNLSGRYKDCRAPPNVSVTNTAVGGATASSTGSSYNRGQHPFPVLVRPSSSSFSKHDGAGNVLAPNTLHVVVTTATAASANNAGAMAAPPPQNSTFQETISGMVAPTPVMLLAAAAAAQPPMPADNASSSWRAEVTALISQYPPSMIFAVGGCRLYYRVCAADRPRDVAQDTRARSYFHIMVCANMTGTEKRPLMIMADERSTLDPVPDDPTKLPCHFKLTSTTQMQTRCINDWLAYWDWQLQQQQRHVLLFLENSSVFFTTQHFSNIKVVMLSPQLLPLHRGVLTNVKAHYRTRLASRVMATMQVQGGHDDCHQISRKTALIDALYLAAEAWDAVRSDLIERSFIHLGLQQVPEQDDNFVNGFEGTTLPSGMAFDQFHAYVHIDAEIENTIKLNQNSDSLDGRYTEGEALRAIEIMRSLAQQEGRSDWYKVTREMEEFVQQQVAKKRNGVVTTTEHGGVPPSSSVTANHHITTQATPGGLPQMSHQSTPATHHLFQNGSTPQQQSAPTQVD